MLDQVELTAWGAKAGIQTLFAPGMGGDLALETNEDDVEIQMELERNPLPSAPAMAPQMRELFDEVDTNKSGAIDHQELLMIFEKFVQDKSTLEGGSDQPDQLPATDLTSAMIQGYGQNDVLNFEQFCKMMDDNEFWPLLEDLAEQNQ